MFSDCSSLTSLDLSRFDASQVSAMWEMFSGCTSLTALDLSNFDTSKVRNIRDMSDMFSGCSALTTIFSLGLRNRFVSEAKFYECTSLQKTVNFSKKCTDS